jgi:DNA-directed RNA polymerase subunit omega
MLEALKHDDIINKVGGRFKLSSLIQKRLVALNQGSPPLVSIRSQNKMEIVLEEIRQDKIYLDMDENLRIAEGAQLEAGGGINFDLDD